MGDESCALETFLARVDAADRERVHRSVTRLDGYFIEEFRCEASVRRVELRGGPGHDGERTFVAGTMRDVTEQRLSDHARELRIAELTREILSTEQHIGAVAHDLRQPLAAMVMAAQLASKGGDEAQLQTIHDDIGAMGERATLLIDQLGAPRVLAADTLAAEANAVDRFSSAPRTTAVTAKLFGAIALQERAPHVYQQIFEQYDALLARVVQRRVFKESTEDVADVSSALRDIAEKLGQANAGAREVAELHARAIRERTQGFSSAKSQALISEGRMMAFELMGHVVSYYRRRARCS